MQMLSQIQCLYLEELSPSRASSFARQINKKTDALFLGLLALSLALALLLLLGPVEGPDQVAFPVGLDAGSSSSLDVQLLQSLLLLLLKSPALLLNLGILLKKQITLLCQTGQLGLLLVVSSFNLLILSLARQQRAGTAILRASSGSSLSIPRKGFLNPPRIQAEPGLGAERSLSEPCAQHPEDFTRCQVLVPSCPSEKYSPALPVSQTASSPGWESGAVTHVGQSPSCLCSEQKAVSLCWGKAEPKLTPC